MTDTDPQCPVCGGGLDSPQPVDVCAGCHVSLASSGAVAVAATGEFAAITPSAAAAIMAETSRTTQSDERSCNWCGKARASVRKLLSSRNVNICNECVGFCSEIMAAELGDDWRQ